MPQIGLQALATKTPVVGSNIGGIPEIIIPNETGRIFPGGDAEALAVQIRTVFDKPDATRAMVERGRAMVEKKHNVDYMLDEIEHVYTRYLRL